MHLVTLRVTANEMFLLLRTVSIAAKFYDTLFMFLAYLILFVCKEKFKQ